MHNIPEQCEQGEEFEKAWMMENILEQREWDEHFRML